MKLANQHTIEFLIEKYRARNGHETSRDAFYADIIRARRADFFGNTCMYALFGAFLLLLVLLPRGSIYHPAFYWPMGIAAALCGILRIVFNPHYKDSHENMEQICKHMRAANTCLSHSPLWKGFKDNLSKSGLQIHTPLDLCSLGFTKGIMAKTGEQMALDSLFLEADFILKQDSNGVSRRAEKRIRASAAAFKAFGIIPGNTDAEAILARLDHARNFG